MTLKPYRLTVTIHVVVAADSVEAAERMVDIVMDEASHEAVGTAREITDADDLPAKWTTDSLAYNRGCGDVSVAGLLAASKVPA